jgi:hypothetical protein
MLNEMKHAGSRLGRCETAVDMGTARQITIQAVEKVMTFEWSCSQVLNQLMIRFEDRIEN